VSVQDGTTPLGSAVTVTNGTATSPTTLATITLDVNPNPGKQDGQENLHARVSPTNAAGTVQFYDGTTPLGDPVPVQGGGNALLHTRTRQTQQTLESPGWFLLRTHDRISCQGC
jgi:hypothetical protein